MMAIGQLVGDSLGLGGTVISLISVAFVGYAIRSATEGGAFKGVAQNRRPPAGSDPGKLAGRKVFRNP